MKSQPIGPIAPPPMAKEKDAFEVLRVWTKPDAVNQFVLMPTWSDPFAWGMLLVDIAGHVARAYAETGVMTEAQARARIHEGFQAEWDHPTTPLERL